jgi:hypothetical protein
MNQSNLSRLILPLLCLPLAVFAIINLLTKGGNQLGNTFFLLILFGGTMGLVSPKLGLLAFIALQFYVDFLKRLLILGDDLSNQDVMVSLGMGPAIVVMACVNSAFRCLTGKVAFFNQKDLTYFFGCVSVSFLGLFVGEGSYGTGDLTDLAQPLLGSAMLGMTAYATYVILRDRADQHKALKYIVIGAIPMALYTFYQAFNGISAWEERYIRTGLSKVLYSFYLLDGIRDMRPFSTLNTHTSLGAVSAVIFVITILIMMRAKKFFGVKRDYRLLYSSLSLLFIGSCLLSRNRTTYALPFFCLLLVFLFRGGWRTLLFYVSSLVSFVWIVVNSEWLNNQILGWSLEFEKTTVGRAFGTLGTYQARLGGFTHLANPSNWKPFGLDKRDRPVVHDQITETLLILGYVPLFAIIMIGLVLLFWWHRRCLRICDPNSRSLMISLTAIIVSLGVCGVAYGNLLFVAPVNSLLGVLIALGMITIRRDQQEGVVSLQISSLTEFTPSEAASSQRWGGQAKQLRSKFGQIGSSQP